MLSDLSRSERVPADHRLRRIRLTLRITLKGFAPLFDPMYSAFGGRRSHPRKLLKALLLILLPGYNRFFRWFVGLSIGLL
jgi:hypothetical protein